MVGGICMISTAAAFYALHAGEVSWEVDIHTLSQLLQDDIQDW